MPPFNLNEMRSQLQYGGARPALFQVIMTNPINGTGDEKMTFMAKAAQLPASTVGSVNVPYFGRTIKVAGEREFADWSVTVINDEDFLVRNALEQWVNSMNLAQQNLRQGPATSSPASYKSQAQVIQYAKDGDVLREYTLDGIFPTEVSTIDVNWETQNTIEEFTVNFTYDWHYVSGGKTGGAGGQ